MTEEKFWGQYGPGVRRLKGPEPAVQRIAEASGPWPSLEYHEDKVWVLFQELQKKMYRHWCVKQCWRD